MKKQKLNGRFAAAALALVMTSGMTAPVFAEEMQGADALHAAEYTAEAYYGEDTSAKEIAKEAATKSTLLAWDTGILMLTKYFPFAVPAVKEVSPIFADLLGIKREGESSSSEDIEKTRKELNANMIKIQKELTYHMDQMSNQINQKIDQNTLKILNGIKYGNLETTVNSEFLKLHSKTQELNNEIQKYYNDERYKDWNEYEKAVEIAYLIRDNSEWLDDGNIMQQFDRIGDILTGQSFAEDNKDVFQAFFDRETQEVMFTGEAYDKINPYMEHMMAEYYNSYVVITQALDAAKIVAELSEDEDMDDETLKTLLPHKAVLKRFNNNDFAPSAIVEDRMQRMAKSFLDAEDPNSVISHYSVFQYNCSHDRFGLITPDGIKRLSPTLNTFVYENYKETKSQNEADAANPGFSLPQPESILAAQELESLCNYAESSCNWPPLFFLEKIGFDVAQYRTDGKAYFWAGNRNYEKIVDSSTKSIDRYNSLTKYFREEIPDSLSVGGYLYTNAIDPNHVGKGYVRINYLAYFQGEKKDSKGNQYTETFYYNLADLLDPDNDAVYKFLTFSAGGKGQYVTGVSAMAVEKPDPQILTETHAEDLGHIRKLLLTHDSFAGILLTKDEYGYVLSDKLKKMLQISPIVPDADAAYSAVIQTFSKYPNLKDDELCAELMKYISYKDVMDIFKMIESTEKNNSSVNGLPTAISGFDTEQALEILKILDDETRESLLNRMDAATAADLRKRLTEKTAKLEETAKPAEPADSRNDILPAPTEAKAAVFHAELNSFAPTVYPAAATVTTASSGSTSSGSGSFRNVSATEASSPTTGDSGATGMIAVCTVSLLAALLTVKRKKHI